MKENVKKFLKSFAPSFAEVSGGLETLAAALEIKEIDFAQAATIAEMNSALGLLQNEFSNTSATIGLRQVTHHLVNRTSLSVTSEKQIAAIHAALTAG